MPGNISPDSQSGGSIDVTGLVTDAEFAAAYPQPLIAAPDYADNGIAAARGDIMMQESATGPWFRVPKAIWTDATKRDLLINGAGGSLRLTIPTTAYAVGQNGTGGYTTTITASGGATFVGGEYTWTNTSGNLRGLVMTPTSGNKAVSCTLTGTPSSAGTSTVVITATDALGQVATLSATLTIVASGSPALAFTTPALPAAQVGVAYSFDLAPYATGGTGARTFSSSTLPLRGLSLSSVGVISGTPNLSGPISVQASVTDTVPTVVDGGTVTLQINSAAVGPSLDLVDLTSATAGVNHIWWYGDSVVQGEAGNNHFRGGGAGNAVERLRAILEGTLTNLGAGFFGMWRVEWTKGSNFDPGLRSAVTDLSPWGESAGNVEGGVWADAVGGTATTNQLTFTRHSTNVISHVDIEYIDVATLSTGGSYSLDGGTVWTDLPAFTTPAVALHSTVRVATANPSTIKIRSANAAGTARPLAIAGITCYSSDPDVNSGFIVHNMGNAGAALDDLIYASGGRPFQKIWNTGATAVIAGPFTNESQETASAADSLQTLGQSLINAHRTRTLTAVTSSGAGNRTLTVTGIALKDEFSASADVGKVVTHANIPAGTKIASVTSGSVIVLDTDITAIAAQSVVVVCPVTPTIVPVSQFWQVIRKYYPGGASASGSMAITAGTSAISGAPAATFDTTQDVNVVVSLNSTVTGGALTLAASTRLTPTSDTAATAAGNSSPAFTGTSGTFTLRSSYRTLNQMTSVRSQMAGLATTNSLTGCDLASVTDAPYFYSSGALNKTNGLLYDQLHLSAFGHAAMALAVYGKVSGLTWSTEEVYATGALAGDPISPSYNATQINSRAAQMAALNPQGRLYCSTGTAASPSRIVIGAASNATSSGRLINGGTLNNWDLGNVEMFVAPNQPSNVPARNQLARIFTLTSATAPQVDLILNGNAINQSTGDTVNTLDGYYCFGARFDTCGPITGKLTIKNVPGRYSSQSAAGVTGPGAHDEVFHFQNYAGQGGDDLEITIVSDDGTGVTDSASGAKWQYIRNPANAWQCLGTATNTRHGFGGYAMGTGTFLDGSSATDCGVGFNVEAGQASNAGATTGARTTVSVTLGSDGGAGVTTTRCTSAGIRANGNNAGNAVQDNTYQIGSLVVHKHVSTDDADSVGITGTAPNTIYNFVDMQSIRPTASALHYMYTQTNPLFLPSTAKTTIGSWTMTETGSYDDVVPNNYGSTTEDGCRTVVGSITGNLLTLTSGTLTSDDTGRTLNTGTLAGISGGPKITYVSSTTATVTHADVTSRSMQIGAIRAVL